MSILNLNSRPWVHFDPTDKNHREYFMTFLLNRTWRNCPVQFHLERGYGDLTAMIENKLVGYYLGKEFKTDVPDRSDQWATT